MIENLVICNGFLKLHDVLPIFAVLTDQPNPSHSQGKVIRQTKEFFETVFEGHCDVEGGSFIEYFMAKETECLDLFLQCKYYQLNHQHVMFITSYFKRTCPANLT